MNGSKSGRKGDQTSSLDVDHKQWHPDDTKNYPDDTLTRRKPNHT